jgi:hypothetical protein
MTEDILMNVIEYVDVQGRQRLRQTCLHIYAETKKKVGYLRLNEKYSREYMINSAYRQRVLCSIANPKKQVSLSLGGILFTTSAAEILNRINVMKNIHGLDMKGRIMHGVDTTGDGSIMEQIMGPIICEIERFQEDNEFILFFLSFPKEHVGEVTIISKPIALFKKKNVFCVALKKLN